MAAQDITRIANPLWKIQRVGLASPPKINRGFTLTEVMVTAAIVAILAGIAYPSYRDYQIRTNRSEAQQFMLDVVNHEEQYLLNTRRYGELTDLNISAPARVALHYTITADVNNDATPPTYTITAEPVEDSIQADESTLTINSLGIKTPSADWEE